MKTKASLPQLGLMVLLSLSTQSQGQIVWNAYDDFYLTPSTPGWTGATSPSATGSAWGYYVGSFNGFGNPRSVGILSHPWITTSLSSYAPSGDGGWGTGNTNGVSLLFDATGGTGFARYTKDGAILGRYDTPWFSEAPGFSQGSSTLIKLIWSQAAYQGNAVGAPNGPAEGAISLLQWRAPAAGSYTITGSYLSADRPGHGASVAIVDSVGMWNDSDGGGAADLLGTTLLSRTALAQNSGDTFSFTRTYAEGDVIQFQTGSDYQASRAVGWSVNIVPEPSSGALLVAGLGALGLTRLRRRR